MENFSGFCGDCVFLLILNTTTPLCEDGLCLQFSLNNINLEHTMINIIYNKNNIVSQGEIIKKQLNSNKDKVTEQKKKWFLHYSSQT